MGQQKQESSNHTYTSSNITRSRRDWQINRAYTNKNSTSRDNSDDTSNSMKGDSSDNDDLSLTAGVRETALTITV